MLNRVYTSPYGDTVLIIESEGGRKRLKISIDAHCSALSMVYKSCGEV